MGQDKSSESSGQNFWSTLPGILTALAALITAVGGVYLGILANRNDDPPTPSNPPVAVLPTATAAIAPTTAQVAPTQAPIPMAPQPFSDEGDFNTGGEIVANSRAIIVGEGVGFYVDLPAYPVTLIRTFQNGEEVKVVGFEDDAGRTYAKVIDGNMSQGYVDLRALRPA